MSNRSAFVDAVRRMAEAAPEGVPKVSGPHVCTQFLHAEAFHPSRTVDPLIVCDLGTPELRVGLPGFAGYWHRRFPQAEFVYVMPRHHPADEDEAFNRCNAIAPGRLLMSPNDMSRKAWHEVMQAGCHRRRATEIFADLLAVAEAEGRELPERPRVQALLEVSPAVRDVIAYCHRYRGPDRRSLPSRLRRLVSRSTKALVLAFRLLWAVKLRGEGWSPWDVALFLHYEDSSTAARRLKKTWGLGMKELDLATYPKLLRVVALWLMQHTLSPLRTLRANVQALVSVAS